MKDMFDCLEEELNLPEQFVFIVKTRRNKKVRKNNVNTFLYLSEINPDGSLKFSKGLVTALNIKNNYYYDHIKNTIRSEKITCMIFRMTDLQYYQIVPKEFKPIKSVRKEWWRNFKVWLSRKFEKFMTTPIDSSLP